MKIRKSLICDFVKAVGDFWFVHKAYTDEEEEALDREIKISMKLKECTGISYQSWINLAVAILNKDGFAPDNATETMFKCLEVMGMELTDD